MRKPIVNYKVTFIETALETMDKWFGVTYKEDKEAVVNSFKELINNGVYEKDLYSDL